MAIDSLTCALFHSVDDLRHGFTTRRGGVSQGPYESMNLGWSTGDQDDHVDENYALFAASSGFDPDRVIGVRQEHGKQVCVVSASTDLQSLSLTSADAIVTKERQLCLTIRAADCLPILFVDPVTKTIAVAHAGWRGTLASIAKETIQVMKSHMGVDPSEVRVAIGPGIGFKNFEVSLGVAALFEKQFSLSPEVCELRDQSAYLNLLKINQLQLLECGILQANIWASGICTYDSKRDFFSYRRDGKNSGRFIGFLGWAS